MYILYIYIYIYINKQDLALNNLQWSTCHKTKPKKFKDGGFGIKQPTKVDMPLNKETKLNQNYLVKIWILVLLYKSTPSFVEIFFFFFSSLKSQLMYHNLQ